jgi:tetratricopeptide (TPR) repeat protein
MLTSRLAAAYLELNDLESTEKLARQAIVLSESAFGSGDPETLFAQSTLALVHVARGEYARAEPALRRVLHQSERAWGESSYEVAQAAFNLATVHYKQRQYEPARVLLEKSLVGLHVNSIRGRDEIALTESAIAVISAAQGRKRQAHTWLERAFASAEEELPPDHSSLPQVFERAAVARFHLKEYAPGRQLFDRAISLLQAQRGSGSQDVLNALERYARLLRTAKDKAGLKETEERIRAFVPAAKP